MLLALFSVIAAPAMAGQVSGIVVEEGRITVRFDDNVERATSFILTGPDRIAIDVVGTDRGTAGPPAGLVAAIRQGASSPGSTRIVFDLNTPASITAGAFSEDGRALVLELAPIGDDAIADAIAAPRKIYLPPVASRAAPPRSRYSITVPLAAAKAGLAPPRIAGPAGRPLVVIDAGHGGHDPGAIGASGTREKDLTLALARSVRDELLAGGRVRVALTRDTDTFLVLQERAQVARSLKADLFISIHADSAPGSEASGATIYTLSEVASGRAAAAYAARENRADIINGVDLGRETTDVSSILIDLAQRETMNTSARFADLVRREARTMPFRPAYHQMAGFAVLKAPDTPAILLEAGYLTNEQDAERLSSEEGRAEIARTLRRAIEIHFARQFAAR